MSSSANHNAAYWIQHLGLQAHPEGGYFKETHRSTEQISVAHLPPRFSQDHCFSTAIYYLLEAPDFSAFHRIQQDEVWHFYQGTGLTIQVITTEGEHLRLQLGPDPEQGQAWQQVVKAGDWFAATVDDPKGYALVGCTVAPGFEFADFELADGQALAKQHPQHNNLIQQLTR
ncbi:cupin domain-containing protein [Marinicella meishanensis]|uniref:cupin domain-containing protein n=1 Tax=Marinicella meishanensis TaxID=2873263 RepID=UPI001CC01B02|nr:cupin domain-containing protein [Marinicella sp. NBU2979]